MKTSDFGTTDPGLQGVYYVKKLLENHGPLKKTWVTLQTPSSGIHVNKFVLQALDCKFKALGEVHMSPVN
jgi:triacylglycerol esterase/lipase EstA (alpha/beta hydrolase family)